MRFILPVALAVACLCSHHVAYAQGEDPDKLFATGSALVEEGRYEEALVQLEHAQRLDPGIGTQFNIAVCYEKLGKLATAWKNYQEVLQLARASGKRPREDATRAKLDALRPRLATFSIRSEEPGVTVKVDSVIVPGADWETFPVDPGEHQVEAYAATKKPWVTTLKAPDEGQKLDVVVPRLAAIEGQTKFVTTETTNSKRTVGFILGGVGVAGVIVATVTGIVLLQDRATAEERCASGDTHRCLDASGNYDQEGADAVNRGKTLLPINLVAWVVGAAGLGAGTFLILTSGKKSAPRPALAPFVVPGAAGAAATGAF